MPCRWQYSTSFFSLRGLAWATNQRTSDTALEDSADVAPSQFGSSMASSHSFQPFQVSQNQLRQIIAVTAFEQAEHRHVEFAQFLSEPMEILGFQRFLRDGVVGIGVETSGHGNETGFELLQFVQREFEHFAIRLARRVRSDGIVETILPGVCRAGARVARILVN